VLVPCAAPLAPVERPFSPRLRVCGSVTVESRSNARRERDTRGGFGMFRGLRASASCIAVLTLLSCGDSARQRDGQQTEQRRESAYRANNRGVAFMEQFGFEQAADAFRQAIDLDPSVRLA